MSSFSAESWAPLSADAPGKTLHTNLVASLSTLGIPVKTERVLDDRSGKSLLTYFLGVSGVVAGQAVRTRTLITTYKDGTLEKLDPKHPLLDCMRGLHNAHALLDWIKRGEPQRLASSAHGQRSVYVAGSDERSAREVCSTRDLALAAALGVVGIPLVRVEGSVGHHEFIVANASLLPTCLIVPITAREVIRGLRDGSLERDHPEHPVLYAYTARKNRERIVAHIDRQTQLILLRLKNSPQHRSAFVAENALDSAWDQAEHHLAG